MALLGCASGPDTVIFPAVVNQALAVTAGHTKDGQNRARHGTPS